MKLFRLGKGVYLGLVVVLAIVYLGLAFLYNEKPALPSVREGEGGAPGYATVTMAVDLMEAQLSGFPGWLPNDLPPGPGWFLDNLPNFQMGVLQVIRHTSRVLRDNLTRQRTSDAVHKETDLAYSAYANDPLKWAFPSAEGAFSRGNAALLRFRAELGDKASFYPRADNLIQLLDIYISELGAVNTLLLDAKNPNKVKWLAIDNNFYYAQGVAFAMLGIMKAVSIDFQPVLQDKNAGEITGLIVESLEESQFDPWVITNGNRAGILANHSNNLKAYLDDARQKLKSLVSILSQG